VIPHFTDHAANERTYLAWIRTAIALMALGFLIERFDLFLAYLFHARVGEAHLHASPAAEIAGIGLLVFAVLMVTLATRRFLAHARRIDSEEIAQYRATLPNLALGTAVAATAIFLVVYLG
jgi:putative membrane protein